MKNNSKNNKSREKKGSVDLDMFCLDEDNFKDIMKINRYKQIETDILNYEKEKIEIFL